MESQVERSRLVNDQTQELRAIEKEIKKKKKLGEKQRLELEEKLEQLREQHKVALAEFDKEHGIAKTVEKKQESPVVATPFIDEELDRNWTSVSKKELEGECSKRGLSKKGNKEDLVTRLVLYCQDRKSAGAKAGVSSNEVSDRGVAAQCVPKTDSDDSEGKSGSDTPQRDKKNKTKSSGGAINNEMSQPAVVSGGPPAGGKKSQYRDRRDKTAWKGQRIDKADGREAEEEAAHRAKVIASAKADSNDPAKMVDHEEREKQLKREKIIAGVVEKMLANKSKGIKLQDFPKELEAMKVKNFDVELLGYSSLTEWVENQPKSLLHWNAHTETMYPARVGALPSDSEESSSDDSD